MFVLAGCWVSDCLWMLLGMLFHLGKLDDEPGPAIFHGLYAHGAAQQLGVDLHNGQPETDPFIHG